ncbi:MAG: TraR/DksA C4-type zinc finger protein [Proteobacteria bacterium]|nr:TraR/DksA C4-type zinc finger protein [Pseudomonadota bacterium]
MSDDVDRAQLREEEFLSDALARQQRRGLAAGLPAAEFCGEHLQGAGCGEAIPPARRAAVPGCQLCVACQGRSERVQGGRRA